MRFIDWFSGIGAFRLGMERAGHECVGACEIDPKARRVYERHFGIPAWFPRDILEVKADDIPEADIWIGGSPCQGFSPAGKRRGLDDERSGLLSAWLALLAERRPGWWLLENVSNFLSVRRGRDFGLLLAALDDLGCRWGWQVLDARFLGVPQRRRRVFLLARLAGGGTDPAEVLALGPRGGGHPAQGREAAADAAAGPARGAGAVGAIGSTSRGLDAGGDRLVGPLGAAGSRGRGHRVGAEEAAGGQVVINALVQDADSVRKGGRHGKSLVVVALCGSDGGTDDNDARASGLVAIPEVANALSTRQQRLDREDTYVLQCHGSNVGELGALRRGNGSVTGGVPFTIVGSAQGGHAHAREVQFCMTLQSKGAKPTGNDAGTIVAFDLQQDPVSGPESPTLGSNTRHGVAAYGGVRRLTPLECERLMGLYVEEVIGTICMCGSHRNSGADAGPRSRTSPRFVSRVDAVRCQPHVLSAGETSCILHLVHDEPVRLRAYVDFGRKMVVVLGSNSPEKYDRFASPVAGSVSWPLRWRLAATVLRVARMRRSEAPGIQRGRVESQTTGEDSSAQSRGSQHVRSSGSGIVIAAAAVIGNADGTIADGKCTTLGGGRIVRSGGSTWETSLCSVARAIASSIPSEMKSASSFLLEVRTIDDGWTCTCGCEPYSTATCRCPDGPRYSMVGNAVVVPVIHWLAKRLRMVDG